MKKLKNKQGGFVGIIIICLAVIAIGAGMYFSVTKKISLNQIGNLTSDTNKTNQIDTQKEELDQIEPNEDETVDSAKVNDSETNNPLTIVLTASMKPSEILNSFIKETQIIDDIYQTLILFEKYTVLPNDEIAKSKASMDMMVGMMSEDELEELVSQFKSDFPKQIKIISEKITGNTAVVVAKSTDDKRTATVNFVKSGSIWKFKEPFEFK